MLSWLFERLVGQFCRHEWEIVRQGISTKGGVDCGGWYDLHCKKCGDIKSKYT